MDKYEVIIKPLITEKGTYLAQDRNAYCFQVSPRANKTEIKQAVEKIYNVKVADVRTAVRKGKTRRRGYKMLKASDWKRAIVVLDKDFVIDLF